MSKNKFVDTELLKKKGPIIFILFMVLAVLIGYQYSRSGTEILEDGMEREEGGLMEEPVEFMNYRELDGVSVETEAEMKQRNISIMIENNVESWPLSGLNEASVVYEVLAEGRIPRFLAIYAAGELPEKIGPVRSARTYYLELAKPFDSPYLHVGGSPDALSKLKSFGIIDADQFFWSQYFWRERSRYAPHNVYTGKDLIMEMLLDRNLLDASEFEGWQFEDPEPIESETPISPITVNYTTGTYQARYEYDPEVNKYRRFQANAPMKLLDGSEVWTDNVIVQEHNHVIYDAVGRRNIDIIGSGNAWIFRNGAVSEATWRKDSKDELTRYYDENGEELGLNRGKTWINIVETGSFEPPARALAETR